ncbi:MAG TPA: hypothetical protein VGF14_07340 [Alphaproteobacteria bacterium]
MNDIIPATIIWWIVTVDIPLITGFLIMISRVRREADSAIASVRDALVSYKLDVAQSYASITQMKDLESRLVAHLLRIETKLENTRNKTL